MLRGQSLYGSQQAQADDGVIALGRNLYPNLPEDAYDRAPQQRSKFRLVADARLDNRPELISALGLGTTDHARLCDAGLIFEALLKWGPDGVNRFVGEFAFAFWNGANQELLLGRDFLGLRPLNFHRGKDFLAFASMPSGLHALEEIPYDLDREFMTERLALLPRVGRQTYFREVERVEPGHIVKVTREGMRSSSHWKPPTQLATSGRPQEHEEGLRAVFEEAVAAQLRGVGDVVASQLSAGLDSSAVTATAARLFPAGRVVAFTAAPRAGFDGPTPPGNIANEAKLAAETAKLYSNIEHVVIENSGESPLEWLSRNFLYQQQPMSNLTNAVWGQAIHRAAKASGANTIFKGSAGNLSISYAGLECLPSLLSQGRLSTLVGLITDLKRNGMPLVSIGARTLSPFVPPPVWRTVRRFTGRSPGLMSYSSANRAQKTDLKKKSAERAHELAERHPKNPHDARVWALTSADSGGNAYKGVLAEWGLSVRDPTADRRVIEYCLKVPPQEFIRGGIPRSLARRAFADRLPDSVASSRLRGYQSADWYEALDKARPEVEAELAAIMRCAEAGDALDFDWLKETLESWPSDGWNDEVVRYRYRLGLLRGISAGHFMRKVKGTN